MSEKKNIKGGRPKFERPNLQAASFRFQIGELPAFQRCADELGMTLTGWIRQQLRAAAIKQTGDKAMFSREK
jgi:hypothetical protein